MDKDLMAKWTWALFWLQNEIRRVEFLEGKPLSYITETVIPATLELLSLDPSEPPIGLAPKESIKFTAAAAKPLK